MVKAQTSFKVAPFDESTLKKIDRLRRVSGELLPRYSFALADGVRWVPKQAIPLFEAALTAANDDAKKLLGQTIGDDIEAFLASQRKQCAELELDLIKQLEDAPGDALAKCRALWTLITTGKEDAVVALVDEAVTKTK